MLSRVQLPYEKAVKVPTILKVPVSQIPADTVSHCFALCVQRAGGLPFGLNYDPPTFLQEDQGHSLRVRFHGVAESYAEDGSKVVASMSTLFDCFAHVFVQQNAGMQVG